MAVPETPTPRAAIPTVDVAEMLAQAAAQARREAIVDSRLDGHDKAIAEVRSSVSENGTKLDDLKAQVGRVETAMTVAATAASITAQAAKDAAARTIGAKQFYLAFAAVLIALLTLILGGGHV